MSRSMICGLFEKLRRSQVVYTKTGALGVETDVIKDLQTYVSGVS